MLVAFAAIAFLLAAVGIHGLLSFAVSSRQHEIGVRMALGAQRSEIVRMVMRQGVVLAVAGVVPGIAIAYAGGRAMRSLLAGVEPGDAATFAAAGALCVVMTLVGSLVPTLHAVRVDPCHCVPVGGVGPMENSAPGGRPLIRLEAIAKVFYTEEVETHALAEVHLEIAEGEYVSIAGPSGCGKTTLLSILGLIDAPTSGEYLLGGKSVANLDPAERARIRNRQIGFIFQSFNLIGDLTISENVELPLTYRAMSVDDRKARVAEALERVGMTHRAGHYPAQLSGGQQQRVAVARAVAGEPAILLADEPTGNLDSQNGDAVMDLLRDLHQGGATICMVTHDERYTRHADRVVSLMDGRVIDEREVAVTYR